MLPTVRKFPFSDPNWIFEPKWDGCRALCLIQHDSVRFISRNKRTDEEGFGTEFSIFLNLSNLVQLEQMRLL